jgi:EAL domain-containing protein (putative c-di-GMP-specific phosphodiesterase class I)
MIPATLFGGRHFLSRPRYFPDGIGTTLTSFVRDVLFDPNDAAIAKTIVALAQSLGLCVIAEGVETKAQRDFLDSVGCHAYQGYFFSRPLPVDDFEAFAKRGGPEN